jgi:hypothetical protein
MTFKPLEMQPIQFPVDLEQVVQMIVEYRGAILFLLIVASIPTVGSFIIKRLSGSARRW